MSKEAYAYNNKCANYYITFFRLRDADSYILYMGKTTDIILMRAILLYTCIITQISYSCVLYYYIRV